MSNNRNSNIKRKELEDAINMLLNTTFNGPPWPKWGPAKDVFGESNRKSK